ncbi:GyrI-like domain-containing protein [uncultured Eubacterium sp.]|uniref:GyrI-like domain-containing protein n=1 Tax=uncultured Eubacterium sp. TaxID=165185 RepID=UPI003451913D
MSDDFSHLIGYAETSALRDAYNAVLKYVEENGYTVADNPRECYIDGCWNKDNENDYLTEIQIPIKK